MRGNRCLEREFHFFIFPTATVCAAIGEVTFFNQARKQFGICSLAYAHEIIIPLHWSGMRVRECN